MLFTPIQLTVNVENSPLQIYEHRQLSLFSKQLKHLHNTYSGFSAAGNILLKVKPMNGKSFPVNPVFLSCDIGAKWTDLTISKSSKFDVSSSLATCGMNGGVASNTCNNTPDSLQGFSDFPLIYQVK